MYDVVLLSLAEGAPAGTPCGIGCCGGTSAVPSAAATSAAAAEGAAAEGAAAACVPRVPVLACADALAAAGARVHLVTARSDADIDDVLARLDAPPRLDALTWPDSDGKTRLVVAVATDAQLRAVVRRLVRRYAPPPSRRPADLADNRTVPDLPPLAILPLDPIGSTGHRDLAAQLSLPRDPARVAAAVLSGTIRRLDLLRNDGGSITLDGALIGGADDAGRAVPWRARVEVDDTVLSTGEDLILACVVGNAAGYAEFDGMTLLADGDPADGRVEVAVAVPVVIRNRLRRSRVRIEVRRARGRAVSIRPHTAEVQFLDDGVAGSLTRKRAWWIEPGAWAVYAA